MERILLVDDDPIQLQRMTKVLTNALPDADINSASNLQAAFHEISTQKAFSLIITDYLLAEQTDETGPTAYSMSLS